ncbi:hypothetical protein DFJ73DRAFT_69008 [Zopfochytrium polystomum]|nr:hypothetical protein DFJ73DRAFT_69008 [Zopfochytrium polystomum]
MLYKGYWRRVRDIREGDLHSRKAGFLLLRDCALSGARERVSAGSKTSHTDPFVTKEKEQEKKSGRPTQMRNRKHGNNSSSSGAAEIPPNTSREICASLNTKNPEAVVNYVRYWGSIASADKARIVSVDLAGFDMEYTVFSDPATRHELRIQFKQPASSVEDAEMKLKDMENEAYKMLNLDIDRNYKAPGTKTPPNVHLPKAWIIGATAGAWVAAYIVIFLDAALLPPEVATFRKIVGMDVLQRMLTAWVILHSIEAVVGIGLCLYARMPVHTVLLWPLIIVLFGTPSLQNCLKVAVRHAIS